MARATRGGGRSHRRCWVTTDEPGRGSRVWSGEKLAPHGTTWEHGGVQVDVKAGGLAPNPVHQFRIKAGNRAGQRENAARDRSGE